MSALVFYTNPMSRGRVARWMLEEVGQPYRTEVLDYATTLKEPEYLAINPMGKIPAIRHGDTVVTETAAICAYLADAFPDAGLAPAPGSFDRGDYYRWLFFAAGPVETAVVTSAMGFEVAAERERMAGWGSMTRVVEALDHLLQDRDYLAGGTFSAADVYLAALLGWGMAIKSIEARPSFAAYVARTSERPAAVRAREIDDALIAQLQGQTAAA
ncbi:glutathione S-transferase family protein [Sphingosinicellaceae bacterium]|nr:glutathione S-transferase family protein [Sphingosinicellaceae bacterium]